MKILKAKAFGREDILTTYVNDNHIAREDIVVIVSSGVNANNYTLFFYAEEGVKEKNRNIWGNLED